MTIQAANGDVLAARLVLDGRGVARVIYGSQGQFDHELLPLVREGWRILTATTEELALLSVRGAPAANPSSQRSPRREVLDISGRTTRELPTRCGGGDSNNDDGSWAL